MLTDEELEVLQAARGLVVTPHLSSLPDSERNTALRAAYRGLVARGVVDPPTREATAASIGSSTVEVDVRDDVRHVVALRDAARSVVCVARTTAAGEEFWYAHVVGDVLLIEQVSADGLHRFALAGAAHLGDLLADVAVHPETTDGSGPTFSVTDPEQPPSGMIDVLARAVLRTDVVIRRIGDEHPVLTGLFTGPHGAWMTSSRYGDGRPVRVSPRSTAEVRLHLDSLIDGLANDDAQEPAPGGDR